MKKNNKYKKYSKNHKKITNIMKSKQGRLINKKSMKNQSLVHNYSPWQLPNTAGESETKASTAATTATTKSDSR